MWNYWITIKLLNENRIIEQMIIECDYYFNDY